jgi:hypothetical protein
MWASPSTNFVTGWRPRELEIVSTHGTPSPAVGIHTNDYGSSVTCRVTEVVANGVTTQYVCAGWVMTGGQTPATGSTTNFTMTHTNDTVLTWQWTTNYQFTRTAGANGTVTGPTSGWYAAGSSVTVTAVPAANCHFTGWTGDVEGDTNALAMTMTMSQARSVTANFAVDQKTLTVASAPGVSVPAAGGHVYNYGTVVTNTVVSPVTLSGTTQYVCAGATVVGNTATQISATNYVLTLTNTASLTWQWTTNYWLDLGTNGNGTVTPPDQWVPAGGTVALAATPGQGRRFVNWSGDTSLITSGNASSSAVTVTVTRAASLTATFVVPGGTVIIFR